MIQTERFIKPSRTGRQRASLKSLKKLAYADSMKSISVVFTVLILFAGCLMPSVQAFTCWAGVIGFGPVCKGVAVLGHPGYNRYYGVKVLGSGATLVCCEARGYDKNHKEKWYSIGCDYSSLGVAVPWGNVAAYEGIKCRGVPFGAMVLVNWF